MTVPDPAPMLHYCSTVVPDVLTTVCGVDADLAHRIGCDILDRGEAFAALPAHDQRVLIAPFLEEAAHHQPLDASVDSRAKVTVVVRNSLLEQAHHAGLLTSGVIVSLTRSAVGPLSHLLAARRRDPIGHPSPNPFTSLPDHYPRAWACPTALADAFTDDTHCGCPPQQYPSYPTATTWPPHPPSPPTAGRSSAPSTPDKTTT